MSEPMQVAPVEVFRSLTREACDDRAFMLSAVNIPSEIVASVAGYSVYVAHPQGALAAHHLWQYEQEMRRRQVAAIPAPPLPQHPDAWVGSLLYVVLLVLVALAVVNGWGRADLFALGELDSARVQQGQWWRSLTALTLHLDIVHLVSNLGAGVAFGYFASRQIGAGTAWLLIVLAAGVSNFIEAWLGTTSHRSVGASTAVFAALGLLAAHAWRTRLVRCAPMGAPLGATGGWRGTAGTARQRRRRRSCRGTSRPTWSLMRWGLRWVRHLAWRLRCLRSRRGCRGCRRGGRCDRNRNAGAGLVGGRQLMTPLAARDSRSMAR